MSEISVPTHDCRKHDKLIECKNDVDTWKCSICGREIKELNQVNLAVMYVLRVTLGMSLTSILDTRIVKDISEFSKER